MIVNAKKTKAVLMTTGKDKGKTHKHYVRTSGDGKRLLLSPKCPDRWVPLVPHAECLGLVIAYERFEALSTRHRIQKANQRRWILASVLHSRKLSIKYKLQIWRSCVQSTLLYGLHSFCLSPKLARELHGYETCACRGPGPQTSYGTYQPGGPAEAQHWEHADALGKSTQPRTQTYEV